MRKSTSGPHLNPCFLTIIIAFWPWRTYYLEAFSLHKCPCCFLFPHLLSLASASSILLHCILLTWVTLTQHPHSPWLESPIAPASKKRFWYESACLHNTLKRGSTPYGGRPWPRNLFSKPTTLFSQFPNSQKAIYQHFNLQTKIK